MGIRRKSLSNVRAEIVTSAAISAVLGYTLQTRSLFTLTGDHYGSFLNVPTFFSFFICKR
jgi:hypothetical protein